MPDTTDTRRARYRQPITAADLFVFLVGLGSGPVLADGDNVNAEKVGNSFSK